MIELNGTVTLSQAEIDQCINHWQVLDILRAKGVPFFGHVHNHEQWAPHPDYEYTEHMDYDNHTITVTWSHR